MEISTIYPNTNIIKPFLNRSLLYNITTSINSINEYYIHVINRKLNISNIDFIRSIVLNFSQQRNKKVENEDFMCFNKHSIKNYDFKNNDEKDYYIDTLICIFCKETFKNFTSIFIHYKIKHIEYLYFNIRINNPYTNLKEAHIVALYFTKNKEKEEENDNLLNLNSDEIQFQMNDKERQSILIEILKEQGDYEKYISLDKLNMIFNQNEEVKRAYSSIENINSYQNLTVTTNNNSTSNNKITFYKYLPNSDSFMGERLVLFDIFTGEMLDSNNESMGYEMNEDSMRIKLEDKWIDEYIEDVSTNNKEFMKEWNRCIENNKIIVSKTSLYTICQQFILQLKHEMKIREYYKACIIHLLNLHEYELISKKQVIDLIIFMNK